MPQYGLKNVGPDGLESQSNLFFIGCIGVGRFRHDLIWNRERAISPTETVCRKPHDRPVKYGGRNPDRWLTHGDHLAQTRTDTHRESSHTHVKE
jgi:hypothetical protein